MELMIVLAIVIALVAILLPVINLQWNQWRDREASMQINTLAQQLERFHADNRGYPTTEQGLMALVFIPDNVGRPLHLQPPGMIPGTGIPGVQDDTGGGMMGQSAGIGPEALMMNQPNPMMDPMGMGTGMAGAIDPMTGMPIGDPMMGSGQQTTAWTEPRHNPELYLQQRMRPNPYVRERDLLDPWNRPFRYDNSRAFNGLNATGTERPAIWSAGRDGIDGTDDDILGWDPDEAAELIARHQQQLQMRQGQGGGWGQQQFDPMMPQQGFDPMMPQQGFGGDQMMPQFGMPQPGMPQPGMPQPGMPQPGMPQPSMPQPGMPQPGMPQPGMPQPGMPQPGMPQPGMPQPGMPQPGMPQPNF